MTKRSIKTVLLFLFLTGASAMCGEDGERETVIATGIGADQESARREALRNAVRMVVGSMILSDAMIENNQIIRDEIIEFSDGFVTSSRLLNVHTRTDGLIEVELSVTVSRRKLGERLRNAKISETRVNGQNFADKKRTETDRNLSLGGLLKKKMEEAMPAILSVRAGEFKESGAAGEIIVPVTLEIDEAKYREFIRDLSDILRKNGSTPVDRTVDMRVDDKKVQIREVIPFDDKRPETLNAIWIIEQMIPEAKKARIKAFLLPREAVQGFIDGIKWYSFTVALLDGGGAEIARRVLRIEQDERGGWKGEHRRMDVILPGSAYRKGTRHGRSGIKYPVFGYNSGMIIGRDNKPILLGVVTPRLDSFFSNDWAWGSLQLGTPGGTRFTYDVPFVLSEDELAEVKVIQCAIVEAEK